MTSSKPDPRATELRVEHVLLYVAIYETYLDLDAAKQLTSRNNVGAVLKTKGWHIGSRTITDCCSTIQEHLKYTNKLIAEDERYSRTFPTDDGEAAYKWAKKVASCFLKSGDPPPPKLRPRPFVIATHDFYERTILLKVLTDLIADSAVGPVQVSIKQVESVFDGIEEMRTGRANVVLDGVQKKRRFDDTKRKRLGLTFRQVVLIPKDMASKYPEPTVSLEDIRKQSLVFADMPVGDRIHIQERTPEVSRVQLSTTDSVIKYVEKHGKSVEEHGVEKEGVFGIAVNWKTHLGSGLGESFVARILDPPFHIDYLTLFVPTKRGPMSNVTDRLLFHLKKFCADQRDTIITTDNVLSG